MASERCSWCGNDVEPDDGFRAVERVGERRAIFCRLEHIVPWAIQGAHWDPGTIEEPPAVEETVEVCSYCGAQLDEAHILLVRHRGEHRVPDGFCGVAHLLAWAKAGGRWG